MRLNLPLTARNNMTWWCYRPTDTKPQPVSGTIRIILVFAWWSLWQLFDRQYFAMKCIPQPYCLVPGARHYKMAFSSCSLVLQWTWKNNYNKLFQIDIHVQIYRFSQPLPNKTYGSQSGELRCTVHVVAGLVKLASYMYSQ